MRKFESFAYAHDVAGAFIWAGFSIFARAAKLVARS